MSFSDSGWRRDRTPELPAERPLSVKPDWICEVLSESNRSADTIKKLQRYQQSGVPHYWILDPVDRTMTVYRHTLEGYLTVLVAEPPARVRAEPFEAVELDVAVLLGDDPP